MRNKWNTGASILSDVCCVQTMQDLKHSVVCENADFWSTVAVLRAEMQDLRGSIAVCENTDL
eukprot:1162148-Pelagomonas_calceolata.AAC.2